MTLQATDSTEAGSRQGMMMRQCPTLAGDIQSLITHRIEPSSCLARQREFYHKCHRCLYRGLGADACLSEESFRETGAAPVNPDRLRGTARTTDA